MFRPLIFAISCVFWNAGKFFWFFNGSLLQLILWFKSDDWIVFIIIQLLFIMTSTSTAFLRITIKYTLTFFCLLIWSIYSLWHSHQNFITWRLYWISFEILDACSWFMIITCKCWSFFFIFVLFQSIFYFGSGFCPFFIPPILQLFIFLCSLILSLLLSPSFLSFFKFSFYLLFFLFNCSHFLPKCYNFRVFIPYFFKVYFENASVKRFFLLSSFVENFKIDSASVKFLIRFLSINRNIFLLLKNNSEFWILSYLSQFPLCESIKIFVKWILFYWLKIAVLSNISVMILIHNWLQLFLFFFTPPRYHIWPWILWELQLAKFFILDLSFL